MLKKLFLLLTVLCLVSCSCAFAEEEAAEPAYEYALPEVMKTAAVTLEGVAAPELPDPVRVESFSAEGGDVTLTLDGEAGRLVIKELNFMEGTESTIFTKKNVSSAQAHMTGKDATVYTVILSWELEGGAVLERIYDTWSGGIAFREQTVTEKPDPAAYAPYPQAERYLIYNEEGQMVSERLFAIDEDASVSREALYGDDGRLISVGTTWNKAQDVLAVDITPEGEIIRLLNASEEDGYRAYSQDPRTDMNQIGGVRGESYDIWSFDEQLKNYPQLEGGAARLPATATDLPSTMTDLGETAVLPENARLWGVNFGSYLSPAVYVFLTADPLFLYQDGAADLNPDAKDVNGNALKLTKKQSGKTPTFELPEITEAP